MLSLPGLPLKLVASSPGTMSVPSFILRHAFSRHAWAVALGLGVCSTMLHAQEPCATERLHEQRLLTDPAYRAEQLAQRPSGPALGGSVVTLPVVVHVLHLGEPVGTGSNITEAQILGALDDLNDRFSDLNGSGIDLGVRFCLTIHGPNGCPADGIVRVDASDIPDYAELGIAAGPECGADANDVRDLSRWPTQTFFNIWVVHDICGGAAGFATYPSSQNVYYGTVIRASAMNVGALTLVHEVGHALNLRHTFQGDDGSTMCPLNEDCTGQGDLVCDTPPHKQSDCGPDNPCSTEGVWDNSRRNYMSYCTLADRFTMEQYQRVQTALQIAPLNSLVLSQACDPNAFLPIGITVSDICHDSCMASATVHPGCPLEAEYLWPNGDTDSSATGLCVGPNPVEIHWSNGAVNEVVINILDPGSITAEAEVTDATCSTLGAAELDISGGVPDECQVPAVIAVGTGTVVSDVHTPFSDARSATQRFVYTTVAMANAGLPAGWLHGLSFDVVDVPVTTTFQGFTIGLGSSLSGNGTVVFGPQDVTIQPGWNSFAFDAPFLFTGFDDLVVSTCYLNDAAGVAAAPIRATSVSNAAFRGATALPEEACTVATDEPFDVRANIRFDARQLMPCYHVTWSTGQEGPVVDDLPIGTHTARITDHYGCPSIVTVTVDGPAGLSATLDATDACDGCDGLLEADITGASPPFAVLWSNGADAQLLEDVCPGTYTVTITDAADCSVTYAATVLPNVCAGIGEVSEDAAFTVLLAADADALLILPAGDGGAAYTVSVVNAAGALVTAPRRMAGPGAQRVDLGDARAGVYTAIIDRGGERWAFRVLVP